MIVTQFLKGIHKGIAAAAMICFMVFVTQGQTLNGGTNYSIAGPATYGGGSGYYGGTIEIVSGTVTISSLLTMNGGTLIVYPGATLIMPNGLSISTGTITVQGSLRVTGGGIIMNGSGSLSYTGTSTRDTIVGGLNLNNSMATVSVASGVVLPISGDLRNGGTITDNGTIAIVNGQYYGNGTVTAGSGPQGTMYVDNGNLNSNTAGGNWSNSMIFGVPGGYSCNTPPCSTCSGGAVISYSGSPYCITQSAAQSVTLTGTTGGTYSASPAGLTINPSTGAITPSTSTAGTYKVKYAASAYCFTTANVTITAVPTTPAISYSGSPYCTSASTKTVTQTGTAGGTYAASPSGLSINASTGLITPTSSSANAYTITYTTPAAGCTQLTATTNISIITTPATPSGFTGSNTVCSGGSYNFGVTAVPSATSYTWALPGGTITAGSGTNAITMTVGSSSNNITVTATNACGTSGTYYASWIAVSTSAKPATPGTITKPANQCAGSTGNVYSIASVAGANSYTWSVTGTGWAITAGGSTTAATITIGSGAGTVSVTATNGCGTSSASTTGSITPATAPATPGATSSPANLCSGSTGNAFSIASVANATSYTWSVTGTGWSVTAGSLTTAATITIGTGTGSLSITATNACGTSTAAMSSLVPVLCGSTWTGTSSADWNTAANWSPSNIPTVADNVTIPSSVTSGLMPTISTTANVKTLTNNGTISFTSTGALNVSGNISNNGTVTPVAGSTVSFSGNTAQSIAGIPVLYNVTINNTSGGVSLSSAIVVKGTLSLTNGVVTTNSNLTINFDNGGNIAYNSLDAGSISGNVSGRRDVSARSHYIAVPFNGVTAAQVQATTPLYVNPYWKMYTKDFAAQNWAAVTSTTTAMPLGTGFSLSFPAAAPLIFTGTYNPAFTLTGSIYSNTVANKYFMVGNPYPSTLDWSNENGWTKTNVSGAIYYWDAANNRAASYVAGAGTNGATQYIPAMQSFMVTTTGTGGSASVSINNNARLTAQVSPYFRIASDDMIRITLVGSDKTKTDETVIRFNEMATTGFDFDLDAHKILNSGVIPSVYTNSGTNMYSVNSYTSVDSAKYIPVGTKLPMDGSYSLKISGTNPNLDYILIDKLLGTEQRIEADSSYAFSGLRTDDVNRFELQLRVSEVTVPTGVQSSNKSDGLGIYSSTKGFVIKTDRYAGKEANIEILDITGNSIMVLNGKDLSMGATYVPLEIADGTYLVKVKLEGNNFTGMIVLTK